MNTTIALEEKLKEIYEVLKEAPTQDQQLGVLSGLSGISLFQFYYAKWADLEEAEDHGIELVTKIVEYINNGYSFPTFCTGIAGAGWVIEFLNQEEFIEIESDDLLSGLDEYLFEAMKNDIKTENFDFLHGAIGYGYYFLKRYQNTKSTDLKNKYTEFLHHLIEALKKASKEDQNGVWWMFDLRTEEKIKGANLSLSHGMASIINFLSRLHAYDDFKDKTHDLLQGVVTYILNQKNEDTSLSSMFPSWIYEGMETNVKSRLAWCYGDLGIGISLYKAGKALQNTEYQQLALQILKHATKRKDLAEAQMYDAGYCHGAFGVADIYNYMNTETKDQVFKDTAEYWMDQGLKMAIHENGDAGYMQWRGDQNEWKNELNLLEGLAGIGLTMISHLANFETKWNECLLIG